jgi:hypothetical protein
MLERLLQRVDLKAATVAGLAAGTVYVATMEVDNRITGQHIDDLKLLGFAFADDAGHAKLAGIPIHLANAVGLAVVYAAVARRRLFGPPWLRGVVFASVENTLLYPLALLESHHPGIRKGELDRYFSLNAFMQSIPRHITYGAVLGTLYDRLSRKR